MASLTATVQHLQSRVLLQHLGQLRRTLVSDNVPCTSSQANLYYARLNRRDHYTIYRKKPSRQQAAPPIEYINEKRAMKI